MIEKSAKNPDSKSLLTTVPEMSKSEPVYEQMIAEVKDYSIILLDRQGQVKSWNAGAEIITGYSASEVIGRHFELFYLPSDNESRLADSLLEKAVFDGGTCHEGWKLRKDHTTFWASTSVTALHNDQREVIGFSEITHDLTRQKAEENNLREMTRRLQLGNEDLKASEERYHKMIAEVEDYAIILLDPDGTILNWNAGAERIKGYTSSEIVGRNFRTFYLPEDRAARLPERLIDQAIVTGKATHEGWRVRKDGSHFWGSIVITALHGPDNAVIGFSKVTRDLTERKITEDRLKAVAEDLQRSNDELRKSEERYHAMIAEIEDYAIILLDNDGNIRNWNAGAQKIKGYTAEEIVGKNFRIFYLPEDQAAGQPDRLLAKASETGTAVHEGWRKRKDGSRFWGSIVITSLHGADGSLIGFSKVTRDLTAKKQAEDAAQVYLAELEAQNKELEQFAYIASHDLQEPLRKIQTFIGLLQNKSHDPLAERYLHKIEVSAKRMSDLIKSVLNFSRLSKHGQGLVSTDLNVLLDAVKVDFELVLQEKHAKIISDKLPTINCIPTQIHQVFANLVGNALKFSDKTPEIRITAARVSRQEIVNAPDNLLADSYFRIVFADNGIGFDQNYGEQIFAMFQRLHSKDEYAGTGIGLALCRRVMENHNGFIDAVSEPGKGATFSVYFPG